MPTQNGSKPGRIPGKITVGIRVPLALDRRVAAHAVRERITKSLVYERAVTAHLSQAKRAVARSVRA